MTSGSKRAAQWCTAQAVEGKKKLPQRKNSGWTLNQSTTKEKWWVTVPGWWLFQPDLSIREDSCLYGALICGIAKDCLGSLTFFLLYTRDRVMWNHFSSKMTVGLLSKDEGDRDPGGVSLQSYGKRESLESSRCTRETTYGYTLGGISWASTILLVALTLMRTGNLENRSKVYLAKTGKKYLWTDLLI